jgi:cytochrome oxidase Cu insertion factor (SCO1/SenC/PrrC family)
MTEPAKSGAAQGWRGGRTILLIGVIAIAPTLAAYTIYYFFPRKAQVNYGTLLTTAAAPGIDGLAADGTPFRLADLRGRWVLLAGGTSGCDAPCERTLYATRQARTMQGRDQARIVRVWLVAGDVPIPPDGLVREPGLVVARVSPTALAALPGPEYGIWLIDPRGNLVLAYPADPDIKGLANDLARLLKGSSIG